MSNAKISIIVPVYNIEKYIEKSVESLVNQTYKNIEIILIDIIIHTTLSRIP